MDRRRFLSVCGLGITGVAGCTSIGDEHGPTTDATTTAQPDTDLRIEFSGLQTGVVELFEDVYQITSESGTQYLFVDVSVVSGSRPPITDFTFHFDSEAYTPKTAWDRSPLHRGEESSRDYPDTTGDERYRSDTDIDGWIAFQLPERGDVSEARLSWPGGEWIPDESVRNRLATQLPSFTVEEWSVPETVSPDTNPEFGLTVRNDGSQPGHFWGAIDGLGFSTNRVVTLVSQRIPPGESESGVVAGGTYQMGTADNPVETVNYTLLWPGANRSKSARVVYD